MILYMRYREDDENENYFIGYARAKTDETDLTNIKFEKYPDDHTFSPLLFSNEFEEGAGHNSMIKYKDQWYAVYHARNLGNDGLAGDRRNARICKINVNNGVLSAERYADKL